MHCIMLYFIYFLNARMVLNDFAFLNNKQILLVKLQTRAQAN